MFQRKSTNSKIAIEFLLKSEAFLIKLDLKRSLTSSVVKDTSTDQLSLVPTQMEERMVSEPFFSTMKMMPKMLLMNSMENMLVQDMLN